MSFVKSRNVLSSLRGSRVFKSPNALSKRWQNTSPTHPSSTGLYPYYFLTSLLTTTGIIGVCSGLYVVHADAAVTSGQGPTSGLSQSDVWLVQKLHGIVPVDRGVAEARRRLSILQTHFTTSKRKIEDGMYYTAITSSFMHMNWLHLGMNMFAAQSLVPALARSSGFLPFALVWAGSAAGGVYVQLYSNEMVQHVRALFNSAKEKEKAKANPLIISGRGVVSSVGSFGPDNRMVGASAALCGVLGALTAMYPKALVWSSLWLVGISVACETQDWLPMIGHKSHLGGWGFGLLVGAVFLRRVPRISPAWVLNDVKARRSKIR